MRASFTFSIRREIRYAEPDNIFFPLGLLPAGSKVAIPVSDE